MTGPSPVDRGKSGSELHVLTDRAGIPLAVAISAANTNDAEALRPLARALPAVRSRRGPRRRRPVPGLPNPRRSSHRLQETRQGQTRDVRHGLSSSTDKPTGGSPMVAPFPSPMRSWAHRRWEHDRINTGEPGSPDRIGIRDDQVFSGCPCFACPAGGANLRPPLATGIASFAGIRPADPQPQHFAMHPELRLPVADHRVRLSLPPTARTFDPLWMGAGQTARGCTLGIGAAPGGPPVVNGI
ncbi:hypothetical protein DFR69_10534 [Nocardia neocaledoniensis]|uniref:DDE family transposase n=1 Tax=Nocardia neocaledoniensis TaxID=236511 RepID=A0A317NMV6_9NOCA|nr:hypothetical protein DFR69_10534 [Nocardia neocaledoniensis]